MRKTETNNTHNIEPNLIQLLMSISYDSYIVNTNNNVSVPDGKEEDADLEKQGDTERSHLQYVHEVLTKIMKLPCIEDETDNFLFAFLVFKLQT